jgi:hypothetical protein
VYEIPEIHEFDELAYIMMRLVLILDSIAASHPFILAKLNIGYSRLNTFSYWSLPPHS